MKLGLRPLALTAVAVAAMIVPTAAAPTSALAASPASLTSGFYVDPSSSPAAWVAANPTDGRNGAIKTSVAQMPMAHWFGS